MSNAAGAVADFPRARRVRPGTFTTRQTRVKLAEQTASMAGRELNAADWKAEQRQPLRRGRTESLCRIDILGSALRRPVCCLGSLLWPLLDLAVQAFALPS